MICYANNGYSFRAVDDNYKAVDSEVVFDNYATNDQLRRVFPNFDDGPIKSKDERLALLDAEYQPQFTALSQALGMATLDCNQSLIDSIKVDYETLKKDYQTKKEAIA